MKLKMNSNKWIKSWKQNKMNYFYFNLKKWKKSKRKNNF